MRDRKVFREQFLENGIHLYHYPQEQPFGFLSITLPVGEVHGTGLYTKGMPHLLEHMVYTHSRRSPGRHSLKRAIALKGGMRNAETHSHYTTHWVAIPAGNFQDFSERLLSAVFEPVFKQEAIAEEREAVVQERQQRWWFPATTEHDYYALHNWLHVIQDRDLGGTAESLSSIAVSDLQRLHSAAYFDQRTFIVVAGTISEQQLDQLWSTIGALPTTSNKLAELSDATKWEQREYHECAFNEISDHRLFQAGIIHQPLGVQEFIAIDFIMQLLGNADTGVLTEWLREQEHVTYGIESAEVESTKSNTTWRLKIPLRNKEAVAMVRAELWERIEYAIRQPTLLDEEVQRRLGVSVFDYCDFMTNVRSAVHDIDMFGRIISEAQQNEAISCCRDPQYIWSIFQRFFLNAERGEFCAVPASD